MQQIENLVAVDNLLVRGCGVVAEAEAVVEVEDLAAADLRRECGFVNRTPSRVSAHPDDLLDQEAVVLAVGKDVPSGVPLK